MMGSKEKSPSSSSSPSTQNLTVTDMSVSELLHDKYQQELENLTLMTQPLRTVNLFVLASIQYVKQLICYLFAKGGWLMLFSTAVVAFGVLIMTIDGHHEKHLEELSEYFRFGLWWVALGVASSVGLGSGLHTFVLYLGPHIAFFTIKAMQCGRVDLKSAPYDTIQLKRGPSWLDKECSDFGPPLFEYFSGVRVPLSSLLPQVQIEAVLWGFGTALGELPPYFISRAASLSGGEVHTIEEFDTSSNEEKGMVASHLNQVKRWLLSHSQHLNFFTILALASVPNPLFDLAGIMCGQFGIPFWKFFLATLIGKAIIKTHIQTIFVISVCNNQLLDWIENEMIWVLSQIPGVASILPGVIDKLHAVQAKYLERNPPMPSSSKGKKWEFSFASMWNTIVWLVLISFFMKIVNATAQGYLKKQMEEELAARTKKSSTKLD